MYTRHSGLPPRITDRHHDVAINPNHVLRVPPLWYCSVTIKFHQNIWRWHSRGLSWAPVKPLASLHYDTVRLSGKHLHLGLACPFCVMLGFWRQWDTWRVLVGQTGTAWLWCLSEQGKLYVVVYMCLEATHQRPASLRRSLAEPRTFVCW